jgi:hypothetical protein
MSDAYSRLGRLYDYQRRYSADREGGIVDARSNTPAILDGARVLFYAELDSSERLVICQYDGDSGRYVFYCDCRWNVHGAQGQLAWNDPGSPDSGKVRADSAATAGC